MTVADLIEHLQRLPADAPVVTCGFDEFGYKAVSAPEEVRIAPVVPGVVCEFVGEDDLGIWKATGDVFAAVLID